MKTKIRFDNTKKPSKRNTLRAHADGFYSVRINGKWTRRVRELTQDQFLSLLQSDRERLILREFYSGRSVTGSRVIVCRPALREEAL